MMKSIQYVLGCYCIEHPQDTYIILDSIVETLLEKKGNIDFDLLYLLHLSPDFRSSN
jgi:hypothetical protein